MSGGVEFCGMRGAPRLYREAGEEQDQDNAQNLLLLFSEVFHRGRETICIPKHWRTCNFFQLAAKGPASGVAAWVGGAICD